MQTLKDKIDAVYAAHAKGGTLSQVANTLEDSIPIIRELEQRVKVLGDALAYAVEKYGKPGGPWNVPGDPGGWISRAQTALASADLTKRSTRHANHNAATNERAGCKDHPHVAKPPWKLKRVFR